MSYTLFDELASSQQLIAAMIRLAADDHSARIGAWSLRDVAAHLAASEREAFEPRIRSIAAGENPAFGLYTNDETDFSGVHLEEALDEWADTRGRILDFVRGLSDEEMARTGRHEKYGDVTIERYLEIALDHDRDHLRGLERVASGLAR